MTGKDLVVYILQNNLENEEIFKDGKISFLMDEKETAIKFDVGIETVRVWYAFDMIPGIRIGESIYFLKDVCDPRERTNDGKEEN